MRLRATAAVLIIAASIAGAALADKTTVKLDQAAPLLVEKGKTWEPVIQLTRRGRRLDGLRPVLEIQDAGVRQVYRGAELKPGVYRARVVFPHAGTWKYRIRVGQETLKSGNMRVIAD
jgi:hypothetical protein